MKNTNQTNPNRLLHESSPYLQQHAYNPVDWYPWGPDALKLAKETNKPIFLSIGYSACHWCHVMEQESFADSETAALMNSLFVNVKVDREERPDLDGIYMNAVLHIHGYVGWPMSVWLTPDLKPFYAGTYFPPTARHHLPSFVTVCHSVADAYYNRRDEVEQSASTLVQRIRKHSIPEKMSDEPTEKLLYQNAAQLAKMFDSRFGGLGSPPKFPHSVDYRLILRVDHRQPDSRLREVALFSLQKMIQGGIYDQLGGGFHRFSVDDRWLVPHFEKMLYDNALITLALLDAFQITKSMEFRDAIIQTLDYVLREMTSPEGAFYSTQDADSEGVEGKFFVWSEQEILNILGDALGRRFCIVYGVTGSGNWKGKNILHRPHSWSKVANDLTIDEDVLRQEMYSARQILFQHREQRIKPGRDEKILTAWNGMMIEAFAAAATVLDEPRFAQAASRAAETVLSCLVAPDGLLYRTAREGKAKLNAYLEDYAYLINGLISLYECTFNHRWFTEALRLSNRMLDQFWDPVDGAFFVTGRQHETLIARSKDPQDGAMPSGNAMAATALVRLSRFTGRADQAEAASRTFQALMAVMTSPTTSCAQLLLALDFWLGPTEEFAIVGNSEDESTQTVLRLIRQDFRPRKVMALGVPQAHTLEAAVPLLIGKPALAANQPTVYVCKNFICEAPLVGVHALEKYIANGVLTRNNQGNHGGETQSS